MRRGRWPNAAALAMCVLPAIFSGCADSSNGGGANSPRCADGGCPACESTEDCPSETTCRDGICQLDPRPVAVRDCGVGQCPMDAGRQCQEGECLVGEVCLGGVCQPAGGQDALVKDASFADASDSGLVVEIPDVGTLFADAEMPEEPEDPDARAPADAGAALDMEAPEHGEGPPDAFVVQPTPLVRPYTYERVPVGDLGELHRVGFHPSGRYAVALERGSRLFVVDWASGQATPVDVGGDIQLRDVAFPVTGEGALIVGTVDGDLPQGVVLWLDDMLWQAGVPAVSELARANNVTFEGVEIPPPGDATWPHPVILGRAGDWGDFAVLWGFDPFGGPEGLGAFHGEPIQHFSRIGCDDLAFVDDAFGNTGVFVACGDGGAETLLYSVVGGVGEWQSNPGNNNLGNTARVARWPGGDYALVVSWSGRAIYRFEGGQLNAYNQAPRFSRQGIYAVAFQPDGRRALILGRPTLSPFRGTVIEYRHDLYQCDARRCDMFDVSIPDFDRPPYNADTDTYLYDAAFRPGCDGGFIVGGQTLWDDSSGQLIRFSIEDGEACR